MPAVDDPYRVGELDPRDITIPEGDGLLTLGGRVLASLLDLSEQFMDEAWEEKPWPNQEPSAPFLAEKGQRRGPVSLPRLRERGAADPGHPPGGRTKQFHLGL